MLVQRELVDIEQGSQTGPLTWRQAMLLGTVDLGQVLDEKGPVGGVVLRPFGEQHDYIVAPKLPQRVQYALLAISDTEERIIGPPSSDMRSLGGKP